MKPTGDQNGKSHRPAGLADPLRPFLMGLARSDWYLAVHRRQSAMVTTWPEVTVSWMLRQESALPLMPTLTSRSRSERGLPHLASVDWPASTLSHPFH